MIDEVKHMKNTFLLMLLLAAGSGVSVYSQQTRAQLLKQAADLNTKGEFGAALDLVAPLLDSDSLQGDEAEAGVAWNIRGLAMQNLGNTDAARRS